MGAAKPDALSPLPQARSDCLGMPTQYSLISYSEFHEFFLPIGLPSAPCALLRFFSFCPSGGVTHQPTLRIEYATRIGIKHFHDLATL